MPEDPSDTGHETESAADGEREPTATPDPSGEVTTSLGASDDAAGAVDDEVQRRLREAYLNDEERALVVTAVRSAERHVVVELRPPHGGATRVERFPAPRDGSLAESEAFLTFLDAAGVSPLDVDELVGTRVPATYDPDEGWRLDAAYAGERDGSADATGEGRLSARWNRAAGWLWTYRYWLVAAFLVGGELLFVAALILLYA